MITNFLKQIGLTHFFNFCCRKGKVRPRVIIPRAEHSVSRSHISKSALKVLYRLREAGFEAYLVGGCVRDLLLNLHPKDFDIATNARPEQIQLIFNNCRLIGRRFRLAHIYFNDHVIEVATFRAAGFENQMDIPSKNLAHSEHGMLVRDNIYGSLEEDVQRRDFTINAIYYDIANYSLIDFVGGLVDLQSKILRVIGDPATRYREDPVRILRVIRFAAKLGFQIDKKSEKPITELKVLLKKVPSARLFDEYIKLFLSGHAYLSFCLLRQHRILEVLFPQVEAILQVDEENITEKFIHLALQSTDKRFKEEKPVAPAFLLAVLLWGAVEKLVSSKLKEGILESQASYEACSEVLLEQQQSVMIPKRLTQVIREVWLLQYRLTKRQGKRAYRILMHPKFRAAYDFCLLRAEVGDQHARDLASWWTLFIEASDKSRMQMVLAVQKNGKKRKIHKNSKQSLKKEDKVNEPPSSTIE